MHLNPRSVQPHRRRRTPDRSSGADQPMVRGCQDRRHQAVPGLSAAIWTRFHRRHTDQPLRAGRQLRLGERPRGAGAAAQGKRGKGGRPRDRRYLGQRQAEARAPLRRGLRRWLVHIMRHYSSEAHVNVGTGEDVTIRELADVISKVVGYDGRYRIDSPKPDGTPRRLLDVSGLTVLGWSARTNLGEGLRKTYELGSVMKGAGSWR